MHRYKLNYTIQLEHVNDLNNVTAASSGKP